MWISPEMPVLVVSLAMSMVLGRVSVLLFEE